MLINLYEKYNEEPLYWRNKAPPDMIEGLDLALQYKNQIETENGLPCFRADLETQITKLQWINSHITTKGGIGSELDFKDLISSYPEHEIIYTDASIDHETGRSGIGVHSPTANLDLAERIQNGTTTCKAEILAIDRAITERTNNTDKLIIIVDSRSALEKITKSGINAKNDKITLNVRRKLIDAKARNKDIKLIWVPSHTGIRGNERADKLANEGIGLNVTELFLNDLPRLEFVGPNTFATLGHLRKIQLDNNSNLRAIDREAFGKQQKLDEIFLNNNSLRTIPFELLDWTCLKIVKIGDNPFKCDCDLYNIKESLSPKVTKNVHSLICFDDADRSKQIYLLDETICNLKDHPFHITQVSEHFDKIKTSLIILSTLLIMGTIFIIVIGHLRYRKGRATRNIFTAQASQEKQRASLTSQTAPTASESLSIFCGEGTLSTNEKPKIGCCRCERVPKRDF
ncbi:hypothetical protein JTB14_028548 [Gonioctena quinquepunctata]|nr:hypothetical protein JTB14_028548 [Gonioctena quinquepunctata]